MFQRPHSVIGILCLAWLTGCGKTGPARSDHPRISSRVVMRDEGFRSAALLRDMRYRVILPVAIAPGRKLPVVYLLHGADGDSRDWSNYSEVAQYAEAGLILIMPQGDYSYYVNAVKRPGDRYEDYIVQDLISDVEAKFPAARDRAHRAIVGVSMGGFGAIKIELTHPDLFVFAGALSPAIDVPRRPFSLRRINQSWEFRSLFGSSDSEERRSRDPFFIARKGNPDQAPYIFMTCGEGDSLLPPNREFAALLSQRRFASELQVLPGGQDWDQWSRQLPGLFESLKQHVRWEP